MKKAAMQVRELAAWGLDVNEKRPASYQGNVCLANAQLFAKQAFDEGSALVDDSESDGNVRLRKQLSRPDLQAEMAGLDWSLGVVDLRRLLAFQRRIILDPNETPAAPPEADDWDGLIDLCFGEARPVVCDAVQEDASVLLRSHNPNLRFRFTDDLSNPLAIHTGSPFFEVAEYRDRWFLRDGYHRAFRCLRAGVFHLPAVIVRARTLADVGAVHPCFFPEEVLFSSAPPRVVDFLDDTLVLQYSRSPLVKTLRITVEESYTLEGENA
jgi:hypothetical protein